MSDLVLPETTRRRLLARFRFSFSPNNPAVYDGTRNRDTYPTKMEIATRCCAGERRVRGKKKVQRYGSYDGRELIS